MFVMVMQIGALRIHLIATSLNVHANTTLVVIAVKCVVLVLYKKGGELPFLNPQTNVKNATVMDTPTSVFTTRKLRKEGCHWTNMEDTRVAEDA